MFMTSTSAKARRGAVRVGARGFMLLEVLVAILIFSVGVLGIVGLQAAMTKAQTGSKFRADASFLAQRVIASMWSDRTSLANYASASCTSNTRCNEWAAAVARALPNGAGAVTVTALPDGTDPSTGAVVAANVTVTITWQPPNEQTHTFTTTSTVSSKSPT
jgi:type IV pilus assembly protein PilV